MFQVTIAQGAALMDQPLDLSITLTSPPQDSSPETIASITVQCETLNLLHKGNFLINPLTLKEREELRWYLEDYWKWPYLEFAERGRRVEFLLIDVGKRLHRGIFGNGVAQSLLQQWQERPEAQRQISIVSDLPGVLSLPWELLHDEQGFLAQYSDHPTSVVRRLPKPDLSALVTLFEPPLRVLLVTARPKGAGFIDPRSIARELLDEMQEHIDAGAVELEFLRPPTFSALSERLRETKRPIHVLHFDGHGAFDRQKGQGMVAFEDDEGQIDLILASDLAQILQNSGVQLAVLTACHSALSAIDDVFSSVAARLLLGGINSVVAMSASFLVTSATRYAEAFYRVLAASPSVSIAQERARRALYDTPRRHVWRRRPDEEAIPVELRDWWVPHFYQQRPVLLQPGETKQRDKQFEQSNPLPRLSDEMPTTPRYGFSGRAREMRQLEHALVQDKLVVVHGFGGVGKTALVREAADWLSRTQMYERACFISFEHGGDAISLLSTLGHYLGIYDAFYAPRDCPSALSQLAPVLKQSRTLIIADNLESILSNGEAPLETPLLTQLWDVLLELANLGAGVVLTSRNMAFGDQRLTPGPHVAYLSVKGLQAEDAYALASRLLTDLRIDRARAPYAELRDLLTLLDHHPLAIQLVLPALRDLPLSKITSDFAALLPRFADDIEIGHNRSLSASLEYSIQGLGEKQLALLPKLAPFEGGASEPIFLQITEIPRDEWDQLRPALEQTSLLAVRRLRKGVVPFLHFHPLLVPYLRYRYYTDELALRERYAAYYRAFTDELEYAEMQQPRAARTLVQRELPNMRRALKLLLEMGELESASGMARVISMFLELLGLGQERDELWRQVDVARTKWMQDGGAATQAEEFEREKDLGEAELRRGNVSAAFAHFSALLAHIEALPQGTPFGQGSNYHVVVLSRLAKCHDRSGHPATAESRLREALAFTHALLEQHPEDQSLTRARGNLLSDLGHVHREQRQYPLARGAYEKALEVDTQLGDLRGQTVDLGELGTLALYTGDLDQAKEYYERALGIFQALDEPAMEATALFQLGVVAQEQHDKVEAQQYYRKSLQIAEWLGDAAAAARVCNGLATEAEHEGRISEAEGWYKRALDFGEQEDSHGPSLAHYLHNIAQFLVEGVRDGRASKERLVEARGYARRALAIRETLDPSSQIWKTLDILATIAALEGHTEEMRGYRRRERQAFAAFAGNRDQIDQEYGPLIIAIAQAATGDTHTQGAVEVILKGFERQQRQVADAVRRIWAGEREWYSLAEGLDLADALLILRVLETIERGPETKTTKEQIMASLPPAILEAWEQVGDAALEGLTPDEQKALEKAILAAEDDQGVKREVLQEFSRSLGTEEGEQILEILPHIWIRRRDATDIENKQLELKLVEQMAPESSEHVEALNNLANLIVSEVREGRSNKTRLVEARTHAERALVIAEHLANSAPIWETLSIFASIAELEGQTEAARDYRRRERETYAAFAGSRKYIDRVNGPLIAAFAAAARGDPQARGYIEAVRPRFEATTAGRNFLAAIQRILAGEREWPPLVEDLDRENALLLLRVLETLAQPAEARDDALEQAFTALPATIREAIREHNSPAVTEAFASLSDQERKEVEKSMQVLLAAEKKASTLYSSGLAAQEGNQWTRAEQYYYESLAIRMQLYDVAGVASVCNELAFIAAQTGRPAEAEAWLKRILEMDEQGHTSNIEHVKHLNNMAYLLLGEVQAGRTSAERLPEARSYATRALAVSESLESFDASSQLWSPLYILADIADLEKQAQEARNYRLRAHEIFAAFAENRYRINQRYGSLIAAIADVALGNTQVQETVETAILELESAGWHIADAVDRIWKGERDWPSLVGNTGPHSAFLILRVLETLEQPTRTQKTTRKTKKKKKKS